MKLRSYLIALTLLAVLPVAVFAAIMGGFLLQHQRETFVQGIEDRALALATAVDSELKGSIATLKALAEVKSLDEGDLAYFRQTATQVLASQSDWININLALPNGRQIVNLRAAEGAPLRDIAEVEGRLGELVRERKPVIGDLVVGPVTKQWDFAVRVPVMRGGRVIYVLSAIVNPDSIARLLMTQGLPRAWEGMVLDRNGRIVARTVEPEKSRGALATESLREALGRSSVGWFRGQTLEGIDAYRAYRRSGVNGWALAMAIPASAVDPAAERAIWTFVFALLGAIGLAIVMARAVGRRISEPIAALASATDVMAQGRIPRVPESSRITELRSLEGALRTAVRAQEALMRTEEQARSVVDHVLDGIITIDERGTIESLNRAAERLFGFTAPEVVGGNVKMLMPDPYREEHDDYVANYLRTGQPKVIGIGREVVGRRSDGSTFPMDLAVSEFVVGGRRSFTGIVRDITERKRAEEALKEADRHKDEFLAMLSHELRNPLAALTTAAHVLRIGAPGDAESVGAHGVLERQTRHMARLIDDLLDITRVRMGKVSLKVEPLNLSEVVAEVVDSWRLAGRLADRAAVSVDLLPAWIHADRARIEQIFSNLLHNALKFTPAGGRIDVRVRTEGAEAVMSLTDNGCGMAPESIAGIFEPFVQAKNSLDQSEGGLGLGLALVKRLAEIHGGSICAESKGLGHGATFTVRIPAATSSHERRPTPAHARPATERNDLAGHERP